MSFEEVDWSDMDPNVVDFVFYQAEKHLESQLQSGISSDSRAISAASILVGFSGVVLAGALALWVSSPNLSILVSCLVASILFLAASWFCFAAAKPIDFYFPGNQPVQWIACLNEPLSVSKGGEIENYQEMIEANEEVLETASKSLAYGMGIAISTPFVAVLAYIATYLIFCQV
jgi:cation transporter-like permease